MASTLHIAQHARGGPDAVDRPAGAAARHAPRPAVPDGARVRRAVRAGAAHRGHLARRARARRARPGDADRGVRADPGRAPVPEGDGRPHPGPCAGCWSRSTTARRRSCGRPRRRGRNCWPACRRCRASASRRRRSSWRCWASSSASSPPGWREAAGAYGEEGVVPVGRRRHGPEALEKVRAYKKELKAAAKISGVPPPRRGRGSRRRRRRCPVGGTRGTRPTVSPWAIGSVPDRGSRPAGTGSRCGTSTVHGQAGAVRVARPAVVGREQRAVGVARDDQRLARGRRRRRSGRSTAAPPGLTRSA